MNNSRIRSVCLAVLLLLLQAGCAAPAPTAAVKRNHDEPAYLNEAAVAALASGDRGTALILLERATVLAPWNETIRSNLAALRQAIPSGPTLETVRHVAKSKPLEKPDPRTAAVPTQAQPAEPAIWPLR